MAIQTASGTTRDKQNKSFVDSPSRGSNYSAQEVFVGNTTENPAPVLDYRGPTKNIFNEIFLAASLTSTIITYTVPTSLRSELLSITLSGENKATYKLKINTVDNAIVRTYYTKYNEVIACDDLRLSSGDVVTITATNDSDSSALFNATMFYKEFL